MRNLVVMTFLLCFLSTQVLGGIAYENNHKQHGDLHGLIHELGQPHSHDYEDEYKFELSYSDEAIEHIEQDSHCGAVVPVSTLPIMLSDRKSSGAVFWYANNWSSPFLPHTKPPPRQ